MTRIRTLSSSCLAVFSALVILGASQRVAAEENGRSATPEALVEMAYAAEVSGEPAVRSALVAGAIERDPDNERARWLAGQVRHKGGWVTAAEAEQAGALDRLLREYVQRRDMCGEDAASRLRLANWCRDHDMFDREKAHLTELVAWHGGEDSKVMARLGMVKFLGQWLPKDAVEEHRRFDDEQRRLETRWRPTVVRWKDDLAAGSEAAYQCLRERLKEVTELEALPLVEEILSTYSERAGLVVVAHLDAQPNQQATESLVRHAVFSEFAAVRVAAAEALKKRPKYNYIPMLIAGLVAPLEIEIEFPYGDRGYRRTTVVQRGVDYDVRHVSHQAMYLTEYLTEYVWRSGRTMSQRSKIRAYDYWSKGVQPGRYVEQGTEKTRRNDRISEALDALTGERYGSPDGWQDWWRDYTEYEKKEKPIYDTHVYQLRYAYKLSTKTIVLPSCLASGTPVATETGPRAIEQILPGDRVLAQNPETGELEYKVVLHRTVRRLGEMRRVSLGNDSVTVTLGHPFWIVGKGWQMAKELEVGDRVHCLEGSREVTAIDGLPEDVAYNLLVDDFSTYFAGASRVLLHDNTMPRPTEAILPGFVASGRYGYSDLTSSR